MTSPTYPHTPTISYTDHKGKKHIGKLVDAAGDFATYYFPTGMDGDRSASRSWHQVTCRGEWLVDLSTKHRFYALESMRKLHKQSQAK